MVREFGIVCEGRKLMVNVGKSKVVIFSLSGVGGPLRETGVRLQIPGILCISEW